MTCVRSFVKRSSSSTQVSSAYVNYTGTDDLRARSAHLKTHDYRTKGLDGRKTSPKEVDHQKEMQHSVPCKHPQVHEMAALVAFDGEEGGSRSYT